MCLVWNKQTKRLLIYFTCKTKLPHTPEQNKPCSDRTEILCFSSTHCITYEFQWKFLTWHTLLFLLWNGFFGEQKENNKWVNCQTKDDDVSLKFWKFWRKIFYHFFTFFMFHYWYDTAEICHLTPNPTHPHGELSSVSTLRLRRNWILCLK